MSTLAQAHGAYYRRYSDDILWICNPADAEAIKTASSESIKRQGDRTLILSEAKTTETSFVKSDKGSYSGDLFSYTLTPQ